MSRGTKALFLVFQPHMEVFDLKTVDCTKNEWCNNALKLLKTMFACFSTKSPTSVHDSALLLFIFCR